MNMRELVALGVDGLYTRVPEVLANSVRQYETTRRQLPSET